MKGKAFAMAAAIVLSIAATAFFSTTDCCDLGSAACCKADMKATCAPADLAGCKAAAEATAPESFPTLEASLGTPATTSQPSADGSGLTLEACCKLSCDETTQTCCGIPCPVPCCKTE